MSAEDRAQLDDMLLKELRRHATQLTEHFDSVQIVATKFHNGNSGLFYVGSGNWYARLGSVSEFLRNAVNIPDSE